MNYTQLKLKKSDEIVQLFYNTFKASENEEEAIAVSGLVQKYFQNYPRQDLKGYIAVDAGQIIGCVFFSQLYFEKSDKKVFLLSPMAVKTNFQGKGIGQKLIIYAHNELRKEGVNLTMTYGDINFYSKTGYKLISEDSIAAPLKLSYPEGWLGHSLDGNTPSNLEGKSRCIPELNDQSLW